MFLSILTLTVIFVLSSCCYYYRFGNKFDFHSTPLTTLRNKRVCLLIAHPDDEVMFFAPTLLALSKSSLGNHIKILCLSSGRLYISVITLNSNLCPRNTVTVNTAVSIVLMANSLAFYIGNSEGLGEIRKKELIKCGLKLGLRKEDDILVIDNKDFPDSMAARWDETKVAALLLYFFAPDFERWTQEASDEGYLAGIDVLITFDHAGISRHPNHISLFHGAKKFISSLNDKGLHWASPVSLYTLTSISLIRKFIFIFDILPSTVDVAVAKMKKVGNFRDQPSHLFFFNGPEQLRCAQHAMKSCHQSQMRWYRRGWIIFSRYMVMNDLRLEQLVGC